MKSDCSVTSCSAPRATSTGYCRRHRNAYQRAWRARQRREVLRLKALADDPSKVSRGTLLPDKETI